MAVVSELLWFWLVQLRRSRLRKMKEEKDGKLAQVDLGPLPVRLPILQYY
jgi:hypothetical protein